MQRDSVFRTWLRAKYDIKERIGQGSFSRVYRIVERSTRESFALKVIKRAKLSKKCSAYLDTEIEIMRSIQHRNCCALVDVVRVRPGA